MFRFEICDPRITPRGLKVRAGFPILSSCGSICRPIASIGLDFESNIAILNSESAGLDLS